MFSGKQVVRKPNVIFVIKHIEVRNNLVVCYVFSAKGNRLVE